MALNMAFLKNLAVDACSGLPIGICVEIKREAEILTTKGSAANIGRRAWIEYVIIREAYNL